MNDSGIYKDGETEEQIWIANRIQLWTNSVADIHVGIFNKQGDM